MSVISSVSHKVSEIDASALGKSAIALSGGGTVAQWLTEFGSPILIVLNIALAIGGIYLMSLKIRQQIRANKNT